LVSIIIITQSIEYESVAGQV